MTDSKPVAEDVAHRARQLSPENVAAFLDEQCGQDTELRQLVEQLLKSGKTPSSLGIAGDLTGQTVDYEASRQWAEAETQATDFTLGPPTSPSQQLGPYRLKELIGKGGMGEVWLAEQSEPIRRRVALKIIKSGMDSEVVIARFEVERQALAMMNHPGIARVLDAGTTEQGQPYFVMELVDGERIVDFCDKKRMSLDERLELFMDVCNAIQHAHLKGILHRDLKPSNVMVSLHDGRPQVKVIDFGLAKATKDFATEDTGRLSDATLTEQGQFVGTPRYTSPEQFASDDVDARTDVYSLGVLLYELLSGVLPLELSNLDFFQAVHHIRSSPPIPMSERIRNLGDRADEIAHARSTDKRTMQQRFSGDLNVILMKALEKDRAQRYETPGSLRSDIQRLQNSEPIEARAPTASYRFRKFVQRNKVVAAAGATVLVALVACTTISTLLAIRATKAERRTNAEVGKKTQALRDAQEARHRAEVAQQEADVARKAAEEARDDAEEARDKAENVSNFLVEILRSPDPSMDGRLITVAEMLDRATVNLSRALDDEDGVPRVNLLTVVGRTYHGLGVYDQAKEIHQRAYEYYLRQHGPDARETVTEAIRLAEAKIELQSTNRNPDLPQELQQFIEQQVEICARDFDADDPLTLDALNCLASFCYLDGQLDKSLELHKELVNRWMELHGREHIDTITALGNLANSYHARNEQRQAVEIRVELFALTKKTLGLEHRKTIWAMHNLMVSHMDMGRSGDALKLARETLEVSRKVMGPTHPITLKTLIVLVRYEEAQGRLAKAEALQADVVSQMLTQLPLEDPVRINAITELNRLRLVGGRKKESLANQETMVKELEGMGNIPIDSLIEARSMLTLFYIENREMETALSFCQRVIAERSRELGPKHHQTLMAYIFQTIIYEVLGQRSAAQRSAEYVFVDNHEHLKYWIGHPIRISQYLQNRYAKMGQIDKAIELAERSSNHHPPNMASTHTVLALMWKGEHERAKASRQRLVKAAIASGNSSELSYAILASVFAPADEKEMLSSALELLAEQTDASGRRDLLAVHAIGLANFRLEQVEEAKTWLGESAQSTHKSIAWQAKLVLALMNHESGGNSDAEAALVAYEQATLERGITVWQSPFAAKWDELGAALLAAELQLQVRGQPLSAEDRVEKFMDMARERTQAVPDNLGMVMRLAVLHAWFQQTDQHARVCDGLLDEVLGLKDVLGAEVAAKSCLIYPPVAANKQLLAKAIEVGRYALDNTQDDHPQRVFILLSAGIAEFRKGELETATDLLEPCTESDKMHVSIPARFFRAMIYQRQGKGGLAEQDFEEALRDATEEAGYPPSRTVPTEGLVNHHHLIIWLAHEEAKATLNK